MVRVILSGILGVFEVYRNRVFTFPDFYRRQVTKYGFMLDVAEESKESERKLGISNIKWFPKEQARILTEAL